MRTFFHAVICLGLIAPDALAEERTWTSSDGNQINGEILSLEGDEITLKTAKGEFTFSLSRLSEEDQGFARNWKSPAPGDPKMVATEEVFPEVELGVWPDDVVANLEVEQIEVVKESREEELYVYRSPHFEFRSPVRLSTSVVREFARIFEATFEFAKIMPIGLDPQPWGEGYYPTQLYQHREAYYMDGGMPGSGGMYRYAWRGREIVSSIIKVPLPNLGVEYTGTRWIVDHKKRSDTLTHEIAHQMTGKWLPLMPVWFTEGLAETISSQRYDNGRFVLTSMDRAIREEVGKRSGDAREFPMVNLEKLMTITGEEWAEELAARDGGRYNYPSANLLFFYFLRLEGEGKGESLVKYMKAVFEGMEEKEARTEFLMRGKSFEELQEEVAEGWRSQGLRLTFQ